MTVLVWLLPLLAAVGVFMVRPARPPTPVTNLMWACFTVGCLSAAAACAINQWRPR